MSQRIKGQEVSIIFVRGSTPEFELTDVRNFTVDLKMEVSSQGYLSEKTNRHDDVYNGVKFEGELHVHSADFAAFQRAIVQRAKRETPDVQFNIAGVFSFPSGEVLTRTLPDVKFGELPTNVPARGDFVTVKFSGEADDFVDE